jgi:hypothetical protein
MANIKISRRVTFGEVTISTNGRQGGDGGHGGYFSIQFEHPGDLDIKITQNPSEMIKIDATGDWESQALYELAKEIIVAYELSNREVI